MKPSLHPLVTLPLALAAVSAVPAGAQSVSSTYNWNYTVDDGAITPNGQLGIVRQNDNGGIVHVLDMNTGALLDSDTCAPGFGTGGSNQDSIVATNDRAVLLANCTTIVDLTRVGTGSFILDSHDTGMWGSDLELTPDQTLVAVRGGYSQFGTTGGLFIFDLATGAQLATFPGEPGLQNPGDEALDTVVTTDTHATFLSLGGSASTSTRITVVELRPAGGGAPAVVFETITSPTSAFRDLDGRPSDIALAPDGSHVAVRADSEIALVSLGATPGIVWRSAPSGNPGPLGSATMDTIVITDDRVASLGRWSTTGSGSQVDVFDYAGNQQRHRFPGDPHDLTTVPGTNLLVTRTSVSVDLFDMGVDLTVGGSFKPVDTEAGNASHTGFAAGLDSIEVTADRAVALFRNQDVTFIQSYKLAATGLTPLSTHQMPEPPVDLQITPDGSRVAVVGVGYVEVIDLRTGAVTLAADVIPGHQPGTVPWSDGVALSDGCVLAWASSDVGADGWTSVIDLFNQPLNYCVTTPNSTGLASTIFASGSASVAANDMTLWSSDLPANKWGTYAYAVGQKQAPFGNGNLCIGGTKHRFTAQKTAADGTLARNVDVTGPKNMGGAITAGSTWNFQLLYRDAGSVNTTDGLTVNFLP